MVSQGEGKRCRMVLVESPIDALSLAAIENGSRGKTVYISTDGAGGTPQALVQKFHAALGQVVVPFDADRVREEMAWFVA